MTSRCTSDFLGSFYGYWAAQIATRKGKAPHLYGSGARPFHAGRTASAGVVFHQYRAGFALLSFRRSEFRDKR